MDFNLALITGGSGMVGSNITFGYKPTSKQMDICDIHSIENYINQIFLHHNAFNKKLI